MTPAWNHLFSDDFSVEFHSHCGTDRGKTVLCQLCIYRHQYTTQVWATLAGEKPWGVWEKKNIWRFHGIGLCLIRMKEKPTPKQKKVSKCRGFPTTGMGSCPFLPDLVREKWQIWTPGILTLHEIWWIRWLCRYSRNMFSSRLMIKQTFSESKCQWLAYTNWMIHHNTTRCKNFLNTGNRGDRIMLVIATSASSQGEAPSW